MADNVYLAHHQIKGARWGEMHGPPYPLSRKISTGKSLKKDVVKKEQSKSKNGIAGMLARSKAKKVEEQKRNAKAAALQKAREAKAQKVNEEKAKEELKKKVMSSRSAAMLYKHADLFTTDELREMKNRLQVENEIKNLSPEEIDKGRKFVNAMSTAGDIFNKTSYAMDNGIKTYNNVARVLNAFTSSNLPYVKGISQDNNNKPTTEKYLKMDKDNKIRFEKTTTDDGKGNKLIVEKDYNEKENKNNQKQQNSNQNQNPKQQNNQKQQNSNQNQNPKQQNNQNPKDPEEYGKHYIVKRGPGINNYQFKVVSDETTKFVNDFLTSSAKLYMDVERQRQKLKNK